MAVNAKKQPSKTEVHVATYHPMDVTGDSSNKIAILNAYYADGSPFSLRCIVVPYGQSGRGPRITMQNGTVYAIAPERRLSALIRDALVAQGFEVFLNHKPGTTAAS